MDTIRDIPLVDVRKTLLAEKKSDDYFISGQYEKAADTLQKFLDDQEMLVVEDKCWYLQQIARRKFNFSRCDAESYQRTAFDGNRQLLKPRNGVEYNPLKQMNASRAKNIKKSLAEYETFDELILNLNDMSDNLCIGVKADKFEEAFDKLGVILGYICHRPDKLIRKGPDNLWHVGNNKYIMIECKSEVKETREFIHKSEVGQMENHCGWFEEEYHDANVLRVMVISTNKVASDANFSHKVFIMRKKNLNKLKTNTIKFIKEFINYDLCNLTEDVINSALEHNHLTDTNIWDDYVEDWKR
jgi:hypothetical protein